MAAGPPVAPPVDSRFEVLSFLRSGRLGEWWRARRRLDGQLVTLKVLSHDRFSDPEAFLRFQREIDLVRHFEHPYLPRVLDHGRTDDGIPYLVLENQDGELLSDLLAAGPLSLDRVRVIGAQIARVIAAAAAKHIVHRGIAPNTILVSGDDHVKVIDFGLARVLESETTDVTQVGQRVGEPAYMAPEYIESFRAEPSGDVYGLGVLLYELVAGRPPFVGPALEVLDAHTGEVPIPLSARRPDVPPWLDDLVLSVLAKRPEDRPQPTEVARGLVSGRWPAPEA
jgi:serine/threonine-protein kinase